MNKQLNPKEMIYHAPIPAPINDSTSFSELDSSTGELEREIYSHKLHKFPPPPSRYNNPTTNENSIIQ